MNFVTNLLGTTLTKIGSCGSDLLSAKKNGPYTAIKGPTA
jgi:hypothetical protein